MSTPNGLPGIDELAALANEYFHASGETQVPAGAPSAPLPSPATVPTSPVNPPAPAAATRVHTPPVPSAVGVGVPGPGGTIPPLELPAVPLLPEQAPPVGWRQASPDALAGTPGVPSVPGVPSDSGTPSYPGVPSEPAYPDTALTSFTFPLLPTSLDLHEVPTHGIEVREPIPGTAGLQAFSPLLVPSGPSLGVSGPSESFDPTIARRDFPILNTQVNGRRLVWLDNAATTQKPKAVIDRLVYFYENENSNIHRAAHELAARATDAYEGARESVRRFLNASSRDEIVFTRGTTEAINLVAKSWGAANVGEGDEILVTHLEHHANIVPWQQLCAATGAVLRVAPVDDNGDLIVEEFARLLGPRTKLASFTQVSNALGTVTPSAELIAIAHAKGVPVLLDAAQSVAHLRTDVTALDADFVVFSGHKIYGPTGIGALYAKRAILESMPPWEGGGNMIEDVTFEKTVFHGPPARFEAGTGNIADAVGLGAALDYVTARGIDAVGAYEHGLIEYMVAQLAGVRSLQFIGSPTLRAGAVSFVLEGRTTHEVGAALNREGIAVRSGHHCAQPILRRFGVETSVRPSVALYNTTDDIDALIDGLNRIVGSRR